jgi:hypothetical protein
MTNTAHFLSNTSLTIFQSDFHHLKNKKKIHKKKQSLNFTYIFPCSKIGIVFCQQKKKIGIVFLSALSKRTHKPFHVKTLLILSLFLLLRVNLESFSPSLVLCTHRGVQINWILLTELLSNVFWILKSSPKLKKNEQ